MADSTSGQGTLGSMDVQSTVSAGSVNDVSSPARLTALILLSACVACTSSRGEAGDDPASAVGRTPQKPPEPQQPTPKQQPTPPQPPVPPTTTRTGMEPGRSRVVPVLSGGSGTISGGFEWSSYYAIWVTSIKQTQRACYQEALGKDASLYGYGPMILEVQFEVLAGGTLGPWRMTETTVPKDTLAKCVLDALAAMPAERLRSLEGAVITQRYRMRVDHG